MKGRFTEGERSPAGLGEGEPTVSNKESCPHFGFLGKQDNKNRKHPS